MSGIQLCASLLPRHTESGLYFPFMRGTSPFFPLTHFVRNVLSECVMLGTQLCALLPVCTQRAAIPPPSVTGQSVTFSSLLSHSGRVCIIPSLRPLMVNIHVMIYSRDCDAPFAWRNRHGLLSEQVWLCFLYRGDPVGRRLHLASPLTQ